MNIAVDKRNSSILLVDKENLIKADSKEIIKLINSNNNSVYSIITNIYSGCYNLTRIESIILEYMFHAEKINNKDLLNIICESTQKSTSTVNRAISYLRDKRLIVVNKENIIKLASNVFIDKQKLDNTKFIVIELIDKNKINSSIL